MHHPTRRTRELMFLAKLRWRFLPNILYARQKEKLGTLLYAHYAGILLEYVLIVPELAVKGSWIWLSSSTIKWSQRAAISCPSRFRWGPLSRKRFWQRLCTAIWPSAIERGGIPASPIPTALWFDQNCEIYSLFYATPVRKKTFSGQKWPRQSATLTK